MENIYKIYPLKTRVPIETFKTTPAVVSHFGIHCTKLTRNCICIKCDKKLTTHRKGEMRFSSVQHVTNDMITVADESFIKERFTSLSIKCNMVRINHFVTSRIIDFEDTYSLVKRAKISLTCLVQCLICFPLIPLSLVFFAHTPHVWEKHCEIKILEVTTLLSFIYLLCIFVLVNLQIHLNSIYMCLPN